MYELADLTGSHGGNYKMAVVWVVVLCSLFHQTTWSNNPEDSHLQETQGSLKFELETNHRDKGDFLQTIKQIKNSDIQTRKLVGKKNKNAKLLVKKAILRLWKSNVSSTNSSLRPIFFQNNK
jgi:hypothetical protein